VNLYKDELLAEMC